MAFTLHISSLIPAEVERRLTTWRNPANPGCTKQFWASGELTDQPPETFLEKHSGVFAR